MEILTRAGKTILLELTESGRRAQLAMLGHAWAGFRTVTIHRQ